jgi:hypothetical protein
MTENYEYFTTKKEAIEYYKGTIKNLEDKPDWLIETMIDFSIKYPNYKEYITVENKVKNNIKLTDYEQEKYGSLSWDSKMTHYKKDQIIEGAIDIKAKGEYDDIARDPVAREKYNKYGLVFSENLEPDKEVKIKLNTDKGSYMVSAEVEKLNNGIKDLKVEKIE